MCMVWNTDTELGIGLVVAMEDGYKQITSL